MTSSFLAGYFSVQKDSFNLVFEHTNIFLSKIALPNIPFVLRAHSVGQMIRSEKWVNSGKTRLENYGEPSKTRWKKCIFVPG